MSKVFYDYGRYHVRECSEVWDGDRLVPGYAVINKETGINEYMDIALHQCVRNCRLFELLLKEAESHPYDPNESLWEKKEPVEEGLRPIITN